MREPDGALRFINVLAAGAARAKGINLAFSEQFFVRFRQDNHEAYCTGFSPQIHWPNHS